MKPKKNSRADLEKKKKIFFQIGLVTSLALTLSAFEWRQFEEPVGSIGNLAVDLEEEEMIPITHPEVELPLPKPPQPIQIEIVDDNQELPEIDIDIPDMEELPDFEIFQEEEAPEAEPKIFRNVGTMPEFPGGYKALLTYLRDNVKYPPMAKDAKVEGKVYVEFIVFEDGSINDIKILNGIGAGCDLEAKRAVKNMPVWSPGLQRGMPVKVAYVLPIKFDLR